MKINVIDLMQSFAKNAGQFAREGAERLGFHAEDALLRGRLQKTIRELEEEIDLQFAEIGALIYATHTGTPASSGDIQEILTYVDSLFEQIEGHEKQLQVLEGFQFCPACDSVNAPENAFCQDCGTKLPQQETEEAIEEILEELAEEDAAPAEEEELFQAGEEDR